MKFTSVITLASAATAFVLPHQQTFSSLEVQDRASARTHVVGELEETFEQTKEDIENVFHRISDKVHSKYESFASEAKSSFDDAFAHIEDAASSVNDRVHEAYFDAQGWAQTAKDTWNEEDDYSTLGHGRHGDHGDHGHHGGHHHHKKPNMTVYQLIATSKYTTKLAKLVNEYPDLVEALNGTSANFTVFAPTDRAFEKIPEHHHKPSKEFLKALLTYHVSPEFYPAGRVLVTRTIPTLLKSPALGNHSQRLSTNIGIKGLTVNYYARIVAVDIFGTNGVIHGVDSFIIPPPKVTKIISLLPSEFSTLELALEKTGLADFLNTSKPHVGGTFFAPSNFAFTKLGPKVNAFLFSSYGLKYLKAILKYHLVPKSVLYSDAFYKLDEKSDVSETGIPKGYFHVDLPTLLEDKSLSIDVARYGRLIEIKINAFSRVSIPDGVAYDGVLHVLSDVLIPPKKLSGGKVDEYDGISELSVEELKERLAPYVESSLFNDDL